QLVPKYLLKENTPFLTKQDLPPYQPFDRVHLGDGKTGGRALPAIVWKQVFSQADGKILGTFPDGTPGIVEKKHGQGRAVLFGVLPGQAYLRSALPLLPPDRGATDAAYAHFLPTDMDPNLRGLMVDGFLQKHPARPVVCSEPLVESTCIDTPAKDGKPAR